MDYKTSTYVFSDCSGKERRYNKPLEKFVRQWVPCFLKGKVNNNQDKNIKVDRHFYQK